MRTLVLTLFLSLLAALSSFAQPARQAPHGSQAAQGAATPRAAQPAPAPQPAPQAAPAATTPQAAPASTPAPAPQAASTPQATAAPQAAPILYAVPFAQGTQDAAAPNQPYTLAPGDVLVVRVARQPKLTSTVTVAPNGKITLPLLNEVEVSNLTLAGLTDKIATGLKPRLADPRVTVSIAHLHER